MKAAWWLTAGLLVACSDPAVSVPEQRISDVETDDEEENGEKEKLAAKDAGKAVVKDAGKAASKDAGPASSGNTDGEGNPTPTSTGLPCDVASIVKAKCTSCHEGTGKFGAPMGLETRAAFLSKGDDGRPYYEHAIGRVTGDVRPVMPPPPAQLTEAEKKKLVDWLEADAPVSTETCGGETPTEQAPGETPDVDECDVEMEFRAGINGAPFKVPTTPDYYQCFYFKPEFGKDVTGKGFLPLIDNDKVIHHWLLFVKDDASKKAGTNERCTGVNPGATLIAGWAPGGEPTIAPKDVGIQLPQGPNVVYQLELHYNNTEGPNATDESGVKLCATKNPQKELAAIHYLGSENILVPPGMGTAQSTCKPTKPVTLLSVNPHMHKTGHHAKMVINRKDGTKETYHDAPFEFSSQINYVKTAKLEVGDTLTSTCTFKNDSTGIKTFAEGTEDEMCYLFTLAYPIGAMDTGSDLLGVGLPGPNRCMR